MTWSLATSHLLSSPLHFPCSSLHSAGLLPFYLTHQALTLALLSFLFLQPGESCSYLLKMCSLGLLRSLLSFHLLREAFPIHPIPAALPPLSALVCFFPWHFIVISVTCRPFIICSSYYKIRPGLYFVLYLQTYLIHSRHLVIVEWF